MLDMQKIRKEADFRYPWHYDEEINHMHGLEKDAFVSGAQWAMNQMKEDREEAVHKNSIWFAKQLLSWVMEPDNFEYKHGHSRESNVNRAIYEFQQTQLKNLKDGK